MNVISPETRIIGLPYGEEIMIVGRTMWTQSTSVTDRQTDRQTDGRTELRSQRPCNAERRTVKIIAATTSSCNKSCKTCTTVAALISIIFLAANDDVPSAQACQAMNRPIRSSPVSTCRRMRRVADGLIGTREIGRYAVIGCKKKLC